MRDLTLNETDNKNFYPTPTYLVEKMLNKIPYQEFKTIRSVLEPSAGKGDIAKIVRDKLSKREYSYTFGTYTSSEAPDIDCIEIDINLRIILKENNFRVVYDDFLGYYSMKQYDLIIMNPPFDNGDKHLLKALKMQEHGGKILCLLNAETLINLYSNTRKDLVKQLEKYNANIEFIDNGFSHAERKTNVQTALVYVNIPFDTTNTYSSLILDNLKRGEEIDDEEYGANELITGDFIQQIVDQYNFEIKVGIALIKEYKSVEPYLLRDIKKDGGSTSAMLELNITTENEFIKLVRNKYWTALFNNDKFTANLTSNLVRDYYKQISELENYDFNIFNIKSIQLDLSKNRTSAIEETILNLFEEFSHKHSWYDETSSNIHYYNGWKTNKAYIINKKVIIPLDAYDWYDKHYNPDYKVVDKLSDIIQVLDYLDNRVTKDDVRKILDTSKEVGKTKKIHFKNIDVTFYKKGTCHIEFTNLELLKRFNIFGSQKKGWLPPTYCKKKYSDMTVEEQEVINEFEGRDSYEKVFNNQEEYLINTSQNVLMIGA